MAVQSIDIDLLNKETLKDIKVFRDDQIPFATAISLTQLALGGQIVARRGLGRDFKLRSKRRMRAGVRVTPANKRDFKRNRMFADVYDIDQFLVEHATGGTRTARGGKIAIPGEQLLLKQPRTASGKMKKKWRPQADWFKSINRKPGRPRKKGRAMKPLAFAVRMEHRGVAIGIRTTKERYPVKWLYQFRKKIKLTDRWDFEEDITDFVMRSYGKVFIKNFNKAVATAR